MLMHWEGRHLRRALWVGRDHELLTKGCVGSASLSDIAAVISKGIFIMPGTGPGGRSISASARWLAWCAAGWDG